jgi:Raf kinase inhibitor-like YbhB/YbcL family protein
MALDLKSSAFEPGGAVPKKYTEDGTNVSPPLEWSEPPAGTGWLALVMDDPDAPRGTWVHWVLWGLAADRRELPENVPRTETVLGGARQGRNDFKKTGYGGPAPPKGPAHRYYFKLYALDVELKLPAGSTKADLEKAMKGHVLAQGELMGKYGR